MQCDQIRPLLRDYKQGSLPGYRAAWVVQHLAGCTDCWLAGQSTPTPAPDPTPGPPRPATPPSQHTASLPVQRPAPAWARGTAAFGLGLLLAGLAWALSSAQEGLSHPAPALAPAPGPPAEPFSQPQPDYTASMQQQSGVTLRILRASRFGGRISLEARFDGERLLPPVHTAGWITVTDEGNRPLTAQIDELLSDRTGLTVLLSFPVPEQGDRFTLRFSGIPRLTILPFSLPLPDPPPSIEQVVRPLPGSPSGIMLMNYGTAGDLLHVWLKLPGYLTANDAESLYLADSGSTDYAPVRAESIHGGDTGELLLQYPIPRILQTPLSLKGEIIMQRLIGPWRIDARLITS